MKRNGEKMTGGKNPDFMPVTRGFLERSVKEDPLSWVSVTLAEAAENKIRHDMADCKTNLHSAERFVEAGRVCWSKHLLYAQTALRANRIVESLAAINASERLHNGFHLKIAVVKAEILRHSGETEQAAEILEQAAEIFPMSESVFRQLYLCRKAQNKTSEAVRAAERLALIGETEADYVLLVESVIGHFEADADWSEIDKKTIERIEEGLENFPDNVELNALYAEYLFYGENCEDALTIADKVFRLDAERLRNTLTAVFCSYNLGYYERCLVYLKSLEEIRRSDLVLSRIYESLVTGKESNSQLKDKHFVTVSDEDAESRRLVP